MTGAGDTAPLDTTPTTNGNEILDLDILVGSTTAWGKDKAVSIAVTAPCKIPSKMFPCCIWHSAGAPNLLPYCPRFSADIKKTTPKWTC